MALTATLLHRASLPAVRITATVPNGLAWTIRGSGVRSQWDVASGVSDGRQIILADPMAPINAEATYSLSYGSTTELTSPIVRTYDGWDTITDLSGRESIDFIRPHEDSLSYEPRAEFFQVPGRAIQPAIYDYTAGAPTGEISARVAGEDLRTLKRLIMENKPLVVLHNNGRCPLVDCDVAPAMTVFFTGVSNNLSSRKDRAERIWSLSYRPVDQAHGYHAPVVTWGEVESEFTSWSGVAALATWGALEGGDWIA